ncbi:MAG: zinc carboxypeptidase, partial [Saprospiraceae bacterium]
MKPFYTFVILLLGFSNLAFAQGQPLSYYLPEQTYDPNIPTPESVLGYQVGDWHVSHDQLTYYMRALANASDRVQLREYARSHEGRPLLLLKTSAEPNLSDIQKIKKQHSQLSNPDE